MYVRARVYVRLCDCAPAFVQLRLCMRESVSGREGECRCMCMCVCMHVYAQCAPASVEVLVRLCDESSVCV